jgi:hypothetical protein
VGFIKYVVEMGSGTTIYIYIYMGSFIKAGSAIPKLKEGGGGVFTDTKPHNHPDRKVIS